MSAALGAGLIVGPWPVQASAPGAGIPSGAKRTAPSAGVGGIARVGAESGAAPADPMESVRQKLAEKLGQPTAHEAATAETAVHNSNPREIKVVTRTAPSHDVVIPSSTTVRKTAAAPKATKSGHAQHDAAHWDYQGEGGPQHWGEMKPEYELCKSGKRQSPIDIRDSVRVQLDPIAFDYRPSGFRVVDNGHTIQVNVASGNTLEVLGRRYELVQFHFHRPSEERINGRQFDMVAHLVHKDLEGKLAVVAVLFERAGTNTVVQSVWNNLPLEKGDEVPARADLDLNALLPKDRSYITYMGSLTTPPCSEGVLWMVLRQPSPISAEQISVFARLYPMNARPVQTQNGRLIKESN